MPAATLLEAIGSSQSAAAAGLTSVGEMPRDASEQSVQFKHKTLIRLTAEFESLPKRPFESQWEAGWAFGSDRDECMRAPRDPASLSEEFELH